MVADLPQHWLGFGQRQFPQPHQRAEQAMTKVDSQRTQADGE